MKRSQPSQRQLRVGEQVRYSLARFFLQGHLQDPLLQKALISVSEVAMSPDLKIATCYLTMLEKKNAEKILELLQQKARFIRGQLVEDLRQLKYMPNLRFRLDTSFDNFARIDALLKSPQVAQDLTADSTNDDKED